MNTEKYTYNDWWDGKIRLIYCPAVFPNDAWSLFTTSSSPIDEFIITDTKI